VVSLLTDFGLGDAYVGTLKAVLLARGPELRLVDLCHAIAPQDILGAAWVLHQGWRYFPRGTVHLAVVDPGVGSARRVLLAREDGHFFLAPDNGLLGPVLSGEARVWCWDRERFDVGEPSATFHGRDVFAPLAAALAGGREPAGLGSEVSDWQRAQFPPTREVDGGWQSEVLRADHFGNLISPLDMGPWARGERPLEEWQVEIGERVLPLVRTYGDVAPGEAAGLIGSGGTLEVAVRDGSAERTLAPAPQTPLRLRKRTP